MAAALVKYVERAGVRLAYEHRPGAGPRVVLVAGLGLSGHSWMGLPDGLAHRGYEVLLPDNRGTGRSATPPPPYQLEQLADDLAAVISDAGTAPAVIVGLSFGGLIAQHLALRHPALVRGLLLAATTCGPPLGTPPRARALALLAAELLGAASPERLGRLLLHPAAPARAQQVLAAWLRVLRDGSDADRPRAAGVEGQLAAGAAHDIGARLRLIDCPTEVVTGDGDRVIAPANAVVLAQELRGAGLTVVEQAGHCFPLERPAVLPALLARLAPWP
ncbi:MAG: alpha/beta hydrolase [Proteobacteria bacterium]|nr:alpha/beta hydrolase [Pseudomonadota bacterium]